MTTGSGRNPYGTTSDLLAAFRAESDRLEQLRRERPHWRIWNVPRANGPTSWRAEPRRYPLNADTADQLSRHIANDDESLPPTLPAC